MDFSPKMASELEPQGMDFRGVVLDNEAQY